MDEQYTTRSEADCVDGWLGIMLGDALWYPLWSEACVAPTAKALASVIGTNAQSAQSAQMAAASSPPQLARSITVSSASSVDPPALMRAPTAAATKAALTRASTIACGGSSSPVAHGLSAEAPSASFSASRTASRAMTGLLASAAASTHATSDETASCASFVADVTTPVAHSLLNSDGGGSSTSGSVGEARNLVLSPGAQRSSVKTATHTPLADSHSAATGAALTSAAVPCDALERAFRLVQSASKVADAAGVAALCERLGLSEAAELAWLSAEDEAALVDLLRPLPARAFRQSLHEHRVRVQSPGAERAWALLTASANQNDARNIARWLLEFGVASDGMLVHADPTQVRPCELLLYWRSFRLASALSRMLLILSSWFHLLWFVFVRIEHEQVRTLADCLKPVPRAMFLHALGAPQML